VLDTQEGSCHSYIVEWDYQRQSRKRVGAEENKRSTEERRPGRAKALEQKLDVPRNST